MTQPSPLCFLFDNGSLRPDSTLSLRAMAVVLEERLKVEVRAVSLLHSSGVDPATLGGQPAELLETAIAAQLEREPSRPIVALPFFFGPSGAVTSYLPPRLEALRRRFPGAQITVGRHLAPDGDKRSYDLLARALEAEVRKIAISADCPDGAPVVLVDHGSPLREVTEVRNRLAEALQGRLGGRFPVGSASMERRPESVYDFNEPLLARRLGLTPWNRGDVIVALQFLSPGRHAGAGGDIAQICAAAEANQPGLRTHITETIGRAPELVEILTSRFAETRSR